MAFAKKNVVTAIACICAAASLLLPLSSSSAVAVDGSRVTPSGLAPDDSADLAKTISATPDGGTVELEARDYRLSKSVFVTARTNLVIRGKAGTRFVLRFDPAGDVGNNANGFKFVRCANLRLENMAFTTDRPVNASGRVAAVDAVSRTYDVRLDPEFPLTGRERILCVDTFDETGAPDYVLESYEKRPLGAAYESLDARTVRMKAPDGYDLAKLDVGHRILFRHETSGNYVFSFNACRGVTLRDLKS